MPPMPPSMTIIGAGGIGCALADALHRGGIAVQLVESNPAKIDWCRTNGVGFEDGPLHAIPIVHFNDWRPSDLDLTLLCVKCFDNATVLKRIPDTAELIPVQNGFEQQLAARCRWEGIASFVSECNDDTTCARWSRSGALHLGPSNATTHNNQPTDHLQLLERTLKEHGRFTVKPVPNILPYKYSKLMYNAAISPLAAVSGLDNGALLTIPKARHLFFNFLRENHAILKQARIPLETIGPFHPDTVQRILRTPLLARCLSPAFARSLRGTYCSMSGDIERGRTEIDFFNGHLLTLAGPSPCPLNHTACTLVRRMTEEQASPSTDCLEAFLR